MSAINNFFCEYCNRTFKQKQGLQRHYERCTEKTTSDNIANFKKQTEERVNSIINDYEVKMQNLTLENTKTIKSFDDKIDKLNDFHKCLVESLKTDYESRIKDIKNEYELRIIKLECTIEINEKRCDDLKDQLIKYQDSTKEIAIKAIENTGPKTTNTINNRNQIYQALQPLTTDFMQEQRQYLTYKDVKNGAHSIAHFASKHTFKDRVFCSDKSRLNFVFKNENDSIIKDPEGVEITKRFIEINREELIRLLNEYLKVIEAELDEDIGTVEYKYWAEKREEILTIRSAILNGNGQHNKENYTEFKRGFLSALSDLIPR